ncbi:MAG: DUF2080 family transposase-associated protein [Desulfarculus sp.]|nr:DUF2080 family transposase-associated protein [Desulfarculus sp.]
MSSSPAVTLATQAKPMPAAHESTRLARFTITGSEVVQKRVSKSGQSGRIYLPLDWVGKNVAVIRLD